MLLRTNCNCQTQLQLICGKAVFANRARRCYAVPMRGVDQRVADFEAQLRRAGLRMTQQRRLILRVLAEADDHPDAKGIFTRAFAHDPTLSLSTVYRTMKLLETRGAIERHAFEDAPAGEDRIADTAASTVPLDEGAVTVAGHRDWINHDAAEDR